MKEGRLSEIRDSECENNYKVFYIYKIEKSNLIITKHHQFS